MSLSGAVIARSPWCRPGEVGTKIQLAAGEPFDDQHDAGAGRTVQSRYLWWFAGGSYVEQSAAALERSTASTVGEDAEVADANQAFGQNVKKESAQELMGGNSHDLLLAAMCIVSPAEGYVIVFEGHESMVGDGDAMGVTGPVVENMFGAAERWLGVDHPVLLEALPGEATEVLGRGKMLE